MSDSKNKTNYNASGSNSYSVSGNEGIKNLSSIPNLTKVKKPNLANFKKLELAKTKKHDFAMDQTSETDFLIPKAKKPLYTYKRSLTKY